MNLPLSPAPWFLPRLCRALAFSGQLALVACGASGVSSQPGSKTADGTSSDSNATTAAFVPTSSTVGTTQGSRSDGPLVALGATGYHVVPFSGCVNGEYYAETQLGNTNLLLLLDSGSATLATASTRCTNCGGQVKYDVSSGTPTSGSASSAYADGSGWDGLIYQDAVAFVSEGALLTPPVNMKFAAMTEQNNFFDTVGSCSGTLGADFDGILGLGPDASRESGTTTLMAALMGAGKLAHDAFTLRTCHVGGSLTLGGYAGDMVAEKPISFPTMSGNFADGTARNGYYTLDLRSVGLGAATLNIPASKLGSTVIDNGTNYTSVGPALYRALCAALSSDANFVANFASMYSGAYESQGLDVEPSGQGLNPNQLDAILPPLVLTFAQANGVVGSLSIPATKSYLVPLMDTDSETYVYAESIYPGGADTDAFGARFVGNSLMRGHTIIFDRAGGQVGFAAQSSGCTEALPGYQP